MSLRISLSILEGTVNICETGFETNEKTINKDVTQIVSEKVLRKKCCGKVLRKSVAKECCEKVVAKGFSD